MKYFILTSKHSKVPLEHPTTSPQTSLEVERSSRSVSWVSRLREIYDCTTVTPWIIDFVLTVVWPNISHEFHCGHSTTSQLLPAEVPGGQWTTYNIQILDKNLTEKYIDWLNSFSSVLKYSGGRKSNQRLLIVSSDLWATHSRGPSVSGEHCRA